MDNQENLTNDIKEPVDSAPKGKFMTQDEIDKLAYANKMRGKELGRKEAEEELSTKTEPQSTNNLSPEEIALRVKAEFDRHLQEQKSNEDRVRQAHENKLIEQEVHESLSKLAANVQTTKSKYNDFDDVINSSGVPNNPKLAYLASKLPNSADILYEMAKSPVKHAAFNELIRDPSTLVDAQKYLKSISDSISQNEEASQQPVPKSPLSKIGSSSVAHPSGNGANMSISDFKSMFKGRY